MSALDVVIIMLVAIGSAIAAVLATIWISSLVQAHRVRIEPTLGAARQLIVTALSGEIVPSLDALSALSRFSERYVVNVMLELAPSVSGSSRSVLAGLGRQIGAIDRASTGLHSPRWSTRLYSARVMTAFGVESEVMYTHFNDRAPEVRAQAAAWCVAVDSSAGIRHLIQLLEDPDGQCRFAAQDALIRIGVPATGPLIAALDNADNADNELAGRIMQIASAIGDDRYRGRAEVVLANRSNVNRASAIAMLASTGNRSTGPTLIALLDDSSDEVVLAATAGLGRIAFWSGAADIEPLLGHGSWEVRRQAAITLSTLGASGTILLQATAQGAGPAAEMALHTLDLQSLSTQEIAA